MILHLSRLHRLEHSIFLIRHRRRMALALLGCIQTNLAPIEERITHLLVNEILFSPIFCCRWLSLLPLSVASLRLGATKWEKNCVTVENMNFICQLSLTGLVEIEKVYRWMQIIFFFSVCSIQMRRIFNEIATGIFYSILLKLKGFLLLTRIHSFSLVGP